MIGGGIVLGAEAAAGGGGAALLTTIVNGANAVAGAILSLPAALTGALILATSTSTGNGEVKHLQQYQAKAIEKARGANNRKTKESATTGREAHRQIEKELEETEGAETEVSMKLKEVRTSGKMPFCQMELL